MHDMLCMQCTCSSIAQRLRSFRLETIQIENVLETIQIQNVILAIKFASLLLGKWCLEARLGVAQEWGTRGVTKHSEATMQGRAAQSKSTLSTVSEQSKPLSAAHGVELLVCYRAWKWECWWLV